MRKRLVTPACLPAFMMVLASGAPFAPAAAIDRAPADARPVPRVDIARQLMITDLRVIEDPVRTNPQGGAQAPWTFQHLMTSMAGRNDPADFTLRWLELWERDQFVNGKVARARPGIRQLVIDPWLRASGGKRLDLSRAPFQLLAIVNRMDLRQQDRARVANAGEGRFVFGVLGADGKPLPPLGGPAPGGFVVILEYELVAKSMAELRTWAAAWQDLGRLRLGAPEFNLALERITRRFSDVGRAPGKPNGSALNQLRSNEIALAAPWELREFHLDPVSGRLAASAVAVTPGTVEQNGTQDLADLVNQNEAALLDGTFELAPAYLGAASLSGPFQATDFPDFGSRTFTVTPLGGGFFDIPWSAASIASNDARHALALNTCNGCHRGETGTGFLQVSFPANHDLPRTLRSPATLAGFLGGIDVPDPVAPTTIRHFADLERRRVDLEQLLASFFDPNRLGLGPIDGTHLPTRVH